MCFLRALLVFALLGIVCMPPALATDSSEAKIIDSYTTIESTGETLLHRTVQLPDPDTGEPEIYMQVFRKNKDGSLSTIPTMTSEKLRKRHETLCADAGGVDATDDAISTISGDMIDFYECDMPVKDSPESRAKPEGTEQNDRDRAAAAGRATITDINGTGIVYSYPGATVLLTASYEVSYFGGPTTVRYSLQTSFCQKGGQYFHSGTNGRARKAWFSRCLVGRATPAGAVQTNVQACPSNGACDAATGAVIVER